MNAPISHLSVTYPRRQTTRGLMMTDYGMLLALAIALLVAIDPLDAGLKRTVATKHLPLLIAVPSALLALAASFLFTRQRLLASVVGPLAPLLGLATFILAGSLVARFALGVQNSFLTAGLYMWSAPMAAAILLGCTAPLHFLRAYFLMLVLGGVIVFAGLAQNYGVRQVYHELEFLFPALAVLFAFRVQRPWLRWMGVAFFLLLALLFKKNTGYLAALIVIAYLLIFYVWPGWSRKHPVARANAIHWAIVALLIAGVVVAYFIINRDTYLPSGNPEFRLLTYEKAWQRFLDSPLYGTLFTAPGSEFFTGYTVAAASNVLPTHSDVLDILANGGLLGAGLWLYGLWRVAKLTFQTALKPRHRNHPLTPYAHALACISLAGVMTYTFNPIILQPGKSLLLWSSLGFLVAIALRIRLDEQEPETPRSARRAGP